MSTLLRYAGIMLLILVATLVVLSCDAGECGSCVHGCCVRSRAVAGLRRMLARIRIAFTVSPGGAGDAVSTVRVSSPARDAAPSIRQEIAPLRI